MKIAVMIGANSRDIGFSFAKTMPEVVAPFGANQEKALAAYNPDNSTDVKAVGTKVAADRMMVETGSFIAKQASASGDQLTLTASPTSRFPCGKSVGRRSSRNRDSFCL